MKPYLAMIASSALTLVGCQSTPQTTMDLLRSGQAGVCSATDVQDTLRGLIMPEEAPDDHFMLLFSDTSLETFDKTVARATCTAAIAVEGTSGPVIERTIINYAISPASQNPAAFVVSAALNPFRAKLTEVLAHDAAEQAREKSIQQAQAALNALIKPGWLIGRWVEASQGSEACANGPYNQFQRAGQFSEDNATGKWQMEDQAVTVILPSATLTFLVADATMDTFTMELENGNQVNFRRCAADEVRLPSTGVPAEAVAPQEPASTPSPDANMME